MAEYRPSAPFTTPMYLLKPSYDLTKGVLTKTFPDPTEKDIFYCAFKTFGGTEVVKNDVLTVEDTATIETWYNPAFAADCLIMAAETKNVYEILGTPENIDMRNQFLKFKIKRLTGGA